MLAEAFGCNTLPWIQRVSYSVRADGPEPRNVAPPLRDKVFACTGMERALYERVCAEFLTLAADFVRRQRICAFLGLAQLGRTSARAELIIGGLGLDDKIGYPIYKGVGKCRSRRPAGSRRDDRPGKKKS